jgi:hypothetical protein
MMIDSKIYKGIEYVQFNELPLPQQQKLNETLNKDLFIKIMIDGQIVSECLQFKDYSYWYNSVYQAQKISTQETVAVSTSVDFGAKELAFK